jgi:hypothetical protein
MSASPNSAWLLDYSHNVYSQAGEDGILEKVFEVIAMTNRWCVEFGAWDGEYLSNTANLIQNHGFSAVLIEAHPERFEVLKKRFGGNSAIHLFNEFVQPDSPSNLDSILSRTPIPKDFDLLSVDIDGNDYHIWKAVGYEPRVVIIEFNPTIPDEVDFVQDKDPSVQQGASALAICRLGKEKGYEPVSLTVNNVILVKRELFPAFGIADNSVYTLRKHRDLITYIFTGYDGTVLLAGSGRMPWHQVPFSPAKFQHLPHWLHRYPDDYGPLRRVAYRALRKFWAIRAGH